MKDAEKVTFGGGPLDRAAELRGDPGRIAGMLENPSARVLPLWRGKPLFEDDALVLLPPRHPVCGAADEPPVFLGLEDGRPVFAADISAWRPQGLDEEAPGGFIDRSVQRHPDLPENRVFAELRAMMARLTARDAGLAATAKAILGWHATHGFCACCGARSVVSMAGWQRNCPACGASHFPRTDPVVIMLITRGNDVLMGRSNGWPEGMYSLLAGFVEPGETIEAAVRREVAEEASIQVGQVGYLASQPWPFPASLMIGCRGEALSGEITVDPEELEDALWVPREEMAAAFSGDHPFLKPARRGAIARFLIENWLADRLD